MFSLCVCVCLVCLFLRRRLQSVGVNLPRVRATQCLFHLKGLIITILQKMGRWRNLKSASVGYFSVNFSIYSVIDIYSVWAGVINYPLLWGSPFVCARRRAADPPFSISWQSSPQQTEQGRPLILEERVDVAGCALIDVSVDCTDNKVGDLCVSSKKRNNHKASWVQFSEPRLIRGALSASFTASSPSVWLI